jgi:hypothetical protein
VSTERYKRSPVGTIHNTPIPDDIVKRLRVRRGVQGHPIGGHNGWCDLTDPEKLEAADEIEQLRAEVQRLTSRSCLTCTHGYVNPKYDVAEVGVTCTRLAGVVKPDFYCAVWEARRD